MQDGKPEAVSYLTLDYLGKQTIFYLKSENEPWKWLMPGKSRKIELAPCPLQLEPELKHMG